MSKDMVREVANTFKCINAAANNGRCLSEFQDERYGKNKRIYTKRPEKSDGGGKCCTVCNTVGS